MSINTNRWVSTLKNHINRSNWTAAASHIVFVSPTVFNHIGTQSPSFGIYLRRLRSNLQRHLFDPAYQGPTMSARVFNQELRSAYAQMAARAVNNAEMTNAVNNARNAARAASQASNNAARAAAVAESRREANAARAAKKAANNAARAAKKAANNAAREAAKKAANNAARAAKKAANNAARAASQASNNAARAAAVAESRREANAARAAKKAANNAARAAKKAANNAARAAQHASSQASGSGTHRAPPPRPAATNYSKQLKELLSNAQRNSEAIPNSNNLATRLPKLKAIIKKLQNRGQPIFNSAGGVNKLNKSIVEELSTFLAALNQNMNPVLENLRIQGRQAKAAMEGASKPNKKSLLEQQMRVRNIANAKKLVAQYKKKYGNLPPNIRNRLQ